MMRFSPAIDAFAYATITSCTYMHYALQRRFRHVACLHAVRSSSARRFMAEVAGATPCVAGMQPPASYYVL